MVGLCRCPPSRASLARLSDWPDELAAFAVGELWVCNVGFCDGAALRESDGPVAHNTEAVVSIASTLRPDDSQHQIGVVCVQA